jgi:hypothetical protein
MKRLYPHSMILRVIVARIYSAMRTELISPKSCKNFMMAAQIPENGLGSGKLPKISLAWIGCPNL